MVMDFVENFSCFFKNEAQLAHLRPRIRWQYTQLSTTSGAQTMGLSAKTVSSSYLMTWSMIACALLLLQSCVDVTGEASTSWKSCSLVMDAPLNTNAKPVLSTFYLWQKTPIFSLNATTLVNARCVWYGNRTCQEMCLVCCEGRRHSHHKCRRCLQRL